MNNKLSEIDSHTNSLFLEFFTRFKKFVSIHNLILTVTPLMVLLIHMYYKLLYKI